MPRIAITEFPATVRAGRVSKYAVEMAELDELLSETEPFLALTDDDGAVVVDEDGNMTFHRNGVEVEDEDGETILHNTYGAGAGCMFDIHKDDLNALVSSLRKVGAQHGRRINTVFADGSVYVKDGGELPAPKADSETEDGSSE